MKRRLTEKKGFTLVELIVVIAIIGVLAAILIPTMLGFVTSSQATSANTTANEIQKSVERFLTQADTEDYGMLVGDTNREVFTITVTNGTWNVSAAQNTSAFRASGAHQWGTVATNLTANTSLLNNVNAETVLGVYLAKSFTDMDNAVMQINCIGGKCISVWYTNETNVLADVTGLPVFGTTQATPWSDGTNPIQVYAWDNQTAGITTSGYIVGTSPVLPLG